MDESRKRHLRWLYSEDIGRGWFDPDEAGKVSEAMDRRYPLIGARGKVIGSVRSMENNGGYAPEIYRLASAPTYFEVQHEFERVAVRIDDATVMSATETVESYYRENVCPPRQLLEDIAALEGELQSLCEDGQGGIWSLDRLALRAMTIRPDAAAVEPASKAAIRAANGVTVEPAPSNVLAVEAKPKTKTARQVNDDGPVPPRSFILGDRHAELTTSQYRLVDYLWRQDRHAATKRNVSMTLWSDEEAQSTRLPSLISRTNGRLLENGIRMTVEASGDYVRLVIDRP